jgi:hypothetical protein
VRVVGTLEQNMFWKKQKRELETPPMARNGESVEVLRVWAHPGQGQEVVLKTTWKDAGAWGLMLADVARHAANAYQGEGHDRAEVLARIRELFDAEFADPTDEPVQI